MTATITRSKLKKSAASKKESPYKRLHLIIPIEDMLWAPLLAENQDCGVEQKDCYEGTDSAASVAQNEFSSKEAIANQIQGQVEQGQYFSVKPNNLSFALGKG